MYALRTNVGVWKCEEFRRLDVCMEEKGIQLLDLPWDFETFSHDKDHFTWQGLVSFAHSLRDALVPLNLDTLYVLADSTIGYWSAPGVRYVEDHLLCAGIHAVVDAVNGSGFAARGDGETFRTRLHSQHRANAILVIGGWNDRHVPWKILERKVRVFANEYASTARA